MTLPKVVVFDLDDTLAPSKSRVDPEMAGLLNQLLDHTAVCIISGGNFQQFKNQVLTALDPAARLTELHLMPTCGTQYYEWADNDWSLVYAENLTPEQKASIAEVLEAGAHELGLWEEQTWGPIIEDRGSQITFSALGQEAPVAAKSAWDKDGKKKAALREYGAARLPGLEVRSGGSTSIDVTKEGVDKAYGMNKLIERLSLQLDEILFVGDRLDVGGNDYPVKAMGVRCVAVERWEDTAIYIRGLIATYVMNTEAAAV